MKEINQGLWHVPVLLSEVIAYLRVEENSWYIDATAGFGGHTEKILAGKGKVLAIDQDHEAVTHLKQRFSDEINESSFKIREGAFSQIDKYTVEAGIDHVRGIIFDLGMSTYQIKQSGRGFSFGKDELLDMRMSQSEVMTAAEIINHYSEIELYEIFRKLGEEIMALGIARAICRTRAIKKIQTTGQLAKLIGEVYKKGGRRERIHPATRVFQALRIAVNDELRELKEGLPKAVGVLERSGRCLVISYHSLEDRIVKQMFEQFVRQDQGHLVVKKPITATYFEIKANPAARSAKLRIFEKL